MRGADPTCATCCHLAWSTQPTKNGCVLFSGDPSDRVLSAGCGEGSLGDDFFGNNLDDVGPQAFQGVYLCVDSCWLYFLFKEARGLH